MAAYIIADIEVTDPKAYERYRQAVLPTLGRYGGRFLVRGGSVERLEGAWAPARLIVLEFPSAERAKQWWASAEYSAVRQLRKDAANTKMIVVAGV